MSAMFIFSEEKRRQLQEERPELSESELTRLLARMWNDLSEKKKVSLSSERRPLPPSVPRGAARTTSSPWGSRAASSLPRVAYTCGWTLMLGAWRAGRREAVS